MLDAIILESIDSEEPDAGAPSMPIQFQQPKLATRLRSVSRPFLSTSALQKLAPAVAAAVAKVRPVVSARLKVSHIFLQPFTRTGLLRLIHTVPSIGLLDPSTLALVSDAGTEARGLRTRARGRYDAGDGSEWYDSDPDHVDPSVPTFDPGAQTAVGGALAGLGDIFGENADPDPGGSGGDIMSDLPGTGGGLLDAIENDPDFNWTPGLPPADDQPAPGGGTPDPTMDPGVYLQVQMDLAAWCKHYPSACTPPDFGASAVEFTGAPDARSRSALASYQRWANSRGESLRTDGELDPATYASLKATVAQLLSGPAPSDSGGSSTALVLAAAAAAAYFLFFRKKKAV